MTQPVPVQNNSFSTSTLVLVSLLAVTCGLLLQQTAETVINTYLTLLPFSIRTI